MSWFFFAMICIIGWGTADLFYKKSSDADDKQSHLKLAVWVGMVMGICAVILIPFSETEMTIPSIISNIIKYSPASAGYILSMIIGYAGLRYLEISIVSPVQNASGALSMICMMLFFVFTGKIKDITEEFSLLDIVGTVLIVAGVIGIAITERNLSLNQTNPKELDKKYITGSLALVFPLLYCLFDTLGTAADGIILDEDSGLGLGEIDVLILYGLTFFSAGLCIWIYLWIRNRKVYNPFGKGQASKGLAAICEEFGQFFYVYAMASKPMLAAPMVASYCIVSVILSRLILKEKLTRSQYIMVITVITGIVILGISDGLAEV